MAKPFFLVSKSLLVHGRASPMGVKVSKWSQSALLGIAVGLESAYSWFDLECMTITLTFLQSETDVPCVQEPCGLWQSNIRGWKGIQMESVNIVSHWQWG